MNRRELLKFSLLSPLLGLFKSRKSAGLTVDKLLKCKEEFHRKPCLSDAFETSGTSSGDAYWNTIEWVNSNPPPDVKWFSYERDHKIEDIPIGFWKAI